MEKNINNRIESMLKTSTGSHMCDSGGDSGRHWQKNQDVDFSKVEPFRFDDWSYSKSIYHYLIDNLSVTKESEKLNDLYKRIYRESNESHLCDMEAFVEVLDNHSMLQYDNYVVGNHPRSNNTYNYDNNLSQTLQYILFYSNDTYYVLLQIHQGADVRGGYTAPQIFEVDDIDQFLMQQQYCNIETKEGSYYTDDSYHFYNNEGSTNESKTYEELYAEGILSIN